jgi:hypothetical protein
VTSLGFLTSTGDTHGASTTLHSASCRTKFPLKGAVSSTCCMKILKRGSNRQAVKGRRGGRTQSQSCLCSPADAGTARRRKRSNVALLSDGEVLSNAQRLDYLCRPPDKAWPRWKGSRASAHWLLSMTAWYDKGSVSRFCTRSRGAGGDAPLDSSYYAIAPSLPPSFHRYGATSLRASRTHQHKQRLCTLSARPRQARSAKYVSAA